MVRDPLVEQAARTFYLSISLLVRRLRQARASGELTIPETAALARLDREGPSTMSALAKLEQISPQSMGATLAALEARELIARSSDSADGRRVVLSVTERGRDVLHDGRHERMEMIARALSHGFTPPEIEQLLAAAPLIERLAQQI